MEEAASSFARLDEAVARSAPGISSLLMLRSAQAIVATRSGPDDASGGETAFAALLGWWYVPKSREFIADSAVLRHCALALGGAAEKICGGRALTPALLCESVGAQDAGGSGIAEVLEVTLRQSDQHSWPSLLLAAELLAGDCGRVDGLHAAIARAVAPLVGGLSADVFVIAPAAPAIGAALHGLAVEARAVRRRVDRYREHRAQAAEEARGFGRGSGSALALLDLLAATPAITIVDAAGALELTVPTVGAAVDRLMERRVLREITGRGRDRVFVYEAAIALAVALAG